MERVSPGTSGDVAGRTLFACLAEPCPEGPKGDRGQHRDPPMTASGARDLPGGSPLAHLQILRAVSQAVNSSLDLDEVLDLSLRALTHVTGHELASLHLISGDGGSCCFAASAGCPSGSARSTSGCRSGTA